MSTRPTPQTPVSPAAAPPPGASIAGRYTLRSVLGRGGMGVVWRAYDEMLHRTVAVKEVLLPDGVPDQDRSRLRARTLREARAVAAVDDPSTVRVFDVVEQGGRPWIVMEYVEGRTLTAALRDDGPMPAAKVAGVGHALVGALQTAHRAGVLHRDIKPSNVLLREDGRVALTDFGIATVASDPSDPTTTGQLLGSPAYIAPERVQGGRPTPAADLWSLGATLWTAVEGRPPFSGSSALATVTAVVQEPPPTCQACTGGLDHLLLAMMSKDPAARPDAATVRQELARISAHDHSPALDAPTATLPAAFDRTMALPPARLGPPDRQEQEAEQGLRFWDSVSGDREPVPSRAAELMTAEPVGAEPGGRRRWPLLAGLVVASVAVAAALASVVGSTGRQDDTRDAAGAAAAGAAKPAKSGKPSAPAAGSSRNANAGAAGAAGGGARRDKSTPTPSPTPLDSEPAVPSGRRGAAPAGWQRYTDPAVGWSIAHPPEWRLRISGASTDYVDPGGRSYLRVETRYPPGPSAEGAWQEQETYFSQRHEGYQRLFLDTVRYRGYDAADWEFRYVVNGATLHALDHGFVAEGRGYALYFQTPEESWPASTETMRDFWRSFRPAGT